MPFTVNKLAALPAVVVMPAGSGIAFELPDIERKLVHVLDAQTEPAIVIVDLRRIALGLDEVIHASNSAARSTSAMLNHLNIREIILVTEDTMLRLAAQGMETPLFGGLNLQVFATPELALDYCRGQAAKASDPQHRQTG